MVYLYINPEKVLFKIVQLLLTMMCKCMSAILCPAFYVVFVPLEYILTIPPHSTYALDICLYFSENKRARNENDQWRLLNQNN